MAHMLTLNRKEGHQFMRRQLYRITLYSVLTYLALSAPNPAVAASQPLEENGRRFCGFTEQQPDNRRFARTFTANLNVGEPRTVRMIYFLPNDRPYRADVVQKMKDEIRKIQSFYAEQMEAHGYGSVTFRLETDTQGGPMVHRLDGRYPDSHYFYNTSGTVSNEIDTAFDRSANVYLIVIDKSINVIGLGDGRSADGVGGRWGKNGGFALVPIGFGFEITAHELGHAFGLNHDFHDGAYIMSYGPGQNRLSACNAEYLSVHPYFNLKSPTEDGEPPIIELTSPHLYPAGSQSVPVRLKVNDSEGLHQVILFVTTIEPHFARGLYEVKACQGLGGDRDTVVRFNYDGVIPSDGIPSLSDLAIHPIHVHAVDKDGDVGYASFGLVEISPHHITTFEGHRHGVTTVAFPRNGTTLAAGAGETVKLWNVAAQQDIGTLRHTGGVTSVAFSSDGTTIATGLHDGTVKLWDVAAKQDIGTLRYTGRVTSVAFSRDGRTLAAGLHDGTVKLWDAVAKRDIATLKNHTEEVTSVAFSRDGAILATGSRDRTVKLWDVATQQEIDTLEEHTAPVYSVAFSPVDATLLATGSWDWTVRLWDVETQHDIATLRHAGTVSSVAFSRDGSTLAAGSRIGSI